ncbi:hypothetical protein AB9P05_07680 [Roseivirga sp. BDSF3-8]|uniref:hypothetical protein n=1 Tax=Roseivirga sp. BDSF3-8 TaxID=3241598 RepID=UPI0035321A89
MAIIENNPWIEGARGMARGAIVYRQRAGRTIVSARPAKCSKPLSSKQKAHHERFGKATAYAKRVRKVEALYEVYKAKEAGFNSWQNLAVKDYMHAPVVEGVFVNGFTGGANERIGVYAYDDFGLVSVDLLIRNGEGEVLESGRCTAIVENGMYEYRLRKDVPVQGGVQVQVEARDLAGNVTVFTEWMVDTDEEEVGNPVESGAIMPVEGQNRLVNGVAAAKEGIGWCGVDGKGVGSVNRAYGVKACCFYAMSERLRLDFGDP